MPFVDKMVNCSVVFSSGGVPLKLEKTRVFIFPVESIMNFAKKEELIQLGQGSFLCSSPSLLFKNLSNDMFGLLKYASLSVVWPWAI